MIRESLLQAMRLLWAHKLRTALTLFGLIWGTAAVIFLVGWGEGVRVMLERGFFKAGKNMGEVWPGRVSEQFTPAVDRRYLWYTMDHVEVLRRRAHLPEVIGAEYWKLLPAVYGARSLNVDVRGIDLETLEIRGVGVAAGRTLGPADLKHRRRVAVLGQKTRERLLGPKGTVGSWIRLGGKPFQVIGFLERVGTQLSRDRMEIDEHVWVPITTLQANWPARWTEDPMVTKILYRMPDRRLLEETRAEVRAILAEQLHVGAEDDEAIGIWSSVEMLNRLRPDRTKGMMFILAATTLLIGGIGVLNMMLDSVHERRQEIGVRLAIGARRRDIVAQFFLETLAVTTLGGLLGVLVGVVGAGVLGSMEVPDLVPVPILSAGVVFLALSIMTGVGISAGVIPAWRASQVDPAETLRME